MLEEIYFDHASTSCPKPALVLEEIEHYFKKINVSPGRSSYKKAQTAEDVVSETRRLLAQLINAEFPHQVMFTLNATHALNIAIKGIVSVGDHIITTNLEHNSVLRPLETLKRSGVITYDIVESDRDGSFDINDFECAIQPKTKAVIVNHASNVIGTLTPIEQIGQIAKKHGLIFIVDASQTIGHVALDVITSHIDILAFTGHKSLLGPSGIGGLYIKDSEQVNTLYEGGTGVNSISLVQPEVLPAKYESGTVNYLGIAGLLGALKYLNNFGVDKLSKIKNSLADYALSCLRDIPEVIIYADDVHGKQIPVISFNVQGIPPQEVAYFLDKKHGIMVRSGLQCAPLVHKMLGTYPHGTVRLSFGYNNTYEQIDILVGALKSIIKEYAQPDFLVSSHKNFHKESTGVKA